ncbi:MAG: HD domain-containing protein [Oscillospiraceae bacterium]
MENNTIGMNRNKTYTYGPVVHATSNNKKQVFCRMANAILKSDDIICEYCPLWNGEYRLPCCSYYDFEVPFEVSPSEAKNHTEGMIKLGISEEFPDFVSDSRINCLSWDESALVYEKALKFAAKAHKGSYRKGTKIPYIVHPVEASMIAICLYNELDTKIGADIYEIAAAAALHDVAEDTKYTIDDIEYEFGRRIAELVQHESENKREGIPPEESWRIRKEEALCHLEDAPLEAKIIAMGDKLSNMRAIARDHRELGDAMWDKFNMKDKAAQSWYYNSLARVLDCFGGTSLYKEYTGLCKEVFGDLE